MADLIDDIIDFWQKILESDIFQLKFIKKDGSTRVMKGTLNFKRIPSNQHPKDFSMPKVLKLVKTSGIVHVYDLEKKGWRSIPFKQVEWLEAQNKRYTINRRGVK
jgi:tRNA G37 N-methylase Trm5